MIHYLFNNIFIENQEENIKKNASSTFSYPINADNDYILLYLLDLYDKVFTLL